MPGPNCVRIFRPLSGWWRPASAIASAGLLLALASGGSSPPQNLSTSGHSVALHLAGVVVSRQAAPQETASEQMLIEEANARTGLGWRLQPGLDWKKSERAGDDWVVIARAGQIPGMLPAELRGRWSAVAPKPAFLSRREGFAAVSLPWRGGRVIILSGNDSRGLLYAAGYLLRALWMEPGRARLPRNIQIESAPQYPVRSHQIGYRFKNNTYDAWTLPMFEQQVRDLAVFGISGLQIIAPHSDDRASSPLYPAPAWQTVIGLSGILAKYGLDCDLYYPEMRSDYRDPAQVAAELKDFGRLVQAMPRVDALYVPGGDPGHTPPDVLLPLVARESVVLHRYHPGATVWVSAQGFDRASFAAFYRYLQTKRPKWLTGVFFGPQSRDSFETQRVNIPRQYQMVFYPDITHTMHAQFPVPRWDPVFAMTEGREPIDPRPHDETLIYRHFASLHSGFQTYSEGVNDDVNKFLWTRLGWSAHADPRETLREYARYFLGPRIGKESSDSFAQGLFELEQDWRGPLADNQQVPRTLAHFQRLERKASTQQRQNWRFELALYRVYYDAYLQQRLRAETAEQQQAIAALSAADTHGSTAAILAAQKALDAPPVAAALRQHIYELADQLWHHVRIQLSVQLYGASAEDRGANLDHVDVPLNDRVWLNRQFAKIEHLPAENARVQALEQIAHWQHPEPGALYDDLGNPTAEPHLFRGEGFARDPEMYHTAIDGIADHTTADGWRLSQLSYAETLYEQPFELRYTGLNKHVRYTLRIVYAGEAYTLPLTLVADGHILIHGPRLRKSNPETVEFRLPAEATADGSLLLDWSRPAGLGGSGRGRQVAEVWLLPEK